MNLTAVQMVRSIEAGEGTRQETVRFLSRIPQSEVGREQAANLPERRQCITSEQGTVFSAVCNYVKPMKRRTESEKRTLKLIA